MKVQKMLNLGRQFLIVTAAIALLWGGTAFGQSPMEVAFAQPPQEMTTQLEEGDRFAPAIESLQNRMANTFEFVGDSMETAVEQMKYFVESAKDTWGDFNHKAADMMDEAMEDTEHTFQEKTNDLRHSLKSLQDSIAESLQVTKHLAADLLDAQFTKAVHTLGIQLQE